jgi:hypothetical protein
MFVPPICRRRREAHRYVPSLRQGWFTGSDEDGGARTNIAASGASN